MSVRNLPMTTSTDPIITRGTSPRAIEWLRRHYPTNAQLMVAGVVALNPVKKAIALTTHSLMKWRGMREESLQAFGLRAEGKWIIDRGRPFLAISNKTCALCIGYWDAQKGCTACPLYLTLGKPCDDAGEMHRPGQARSPFAAFLVDTDPMPMVDALTATMQRVIAKGGDDATR